METYQSSSDESFPSPSRPGDDDPPTFPSSGNVDDEQLMDTFLQDYRININLRQVYSDDVPSFPLELSCKSEDMKEEET